MSISDTTTTGTRSTSSIENGNGKGSSADLANAARSTAEEITSAAKAEFNHILADLQELVRRAGKLSGTEFAVLRQQMTEKLGLAREKLNHLSDDASEVAHKSVSSTEEVIRNHPLQAVGIAALAGIAIGVLLNRH